MPLTFGIFGFAFPAGLVLYWTVSSGFQIGQQTVMLRLGHIGPEAMDRRLAQMKEKAAAKGDKPRSGLMGRLDGSRRSGAETPEPNTATARKPPPRTPGKGDEGWATKPRPKGSTSGRPEGVGAEPSEPPQAPGR